MFIKSKDLLILAVLTFITILAWIGFEAYHTAVTNSVPEKLQVLVEPISPDFKVDVVAKLKSR